MAIPNTTYYESMVNSNPVVREALVDAQGLVHAPSGTGGRLSRTGIGIKAAA